MWCLSLLYHSVAEYATLIGQKVSRSAARTAVRAAGQYVTHHIESGIKSYISGDLTCAYFPIPGPLRSIWHRVYYCVMSICQHSPSVSLLVRILFLEY